MIDRLCAGLRPRSRTILGPGDDCAILAPIKHPVLVTVDSMVEGVHFRIPWFSAPVLGRKALAVNLSDIAAAGGWPLACVINLAIRPGIDQRFLAQLYVGLRQAASEADLDIVGGNITRSPALAITITLIGEVRRSALRRDTARHGDEIFVTGSIGDAALGLKILDRKLKARGAHRHFLVDRFRDPTPRLRAGQALAGLPSAPAAIDVSDGLCQDLGHILDRSGVGAELDADAIPLSDAYRAVFGDDPSVALSSGEDYELLFCMRPGSSAATLTRRLGVAVHRIGGIVRGKPEIKFTGQSAPILKSPGIAGFDQLRSGNRSGRRR
ncbi:MAG: thiamine-phosphate kinase [Candidatus Binataceae bacterium]|nr:thiamine-phosphate kinase [Candidatus Binataceae bacterium]